MTRQTHLLLLIGLLFPLGTLPCHAAPTTIRWAPATTYEDGTPLPPDARTWIFWTDCQNFTQILGYWSLPLTQTSLTVDNTQPGCTCFSAYTNDRTRHLSGPSTTAQSCAASQGCH